MRNMKKAFSVLLFEKHITARQKPFSAKAHIHNAADSILDKNRLFSRGFYKSDQNLMSVSRELLALSSRNHDGLYWCQEKYRVEHRNEQKRASSPIIEGLQKFKEPHIAVWIDYDRLTVPYFMQIRVFTR
jgi:hypothetical protein